MVFPCAVAGDIEAFEAHIQEFTVKGFKAISANGNMRSVYLEEICVENKVCASPSPKHIHVEPSTSGDG